jgi:hypothetical protein
LKYRVPSLERRTTFDKAYGIKVQLGRNSLGNMSGTWELFALNSLPPPKRKKGKAWKEN